ncbi:MAG: SpoIIE family protein phosphatase [Planctomycetota bacterium]|nr:SpoIIE family protein phosphatase [Planctomycetota bacterium]
MITVAPIAFEPILGPPMRPLRAHADQAGEPLIIGRSSACALMLADPDGVVSRQHARLSCHPGEPSPWHLTDLNSRHGTFVNGQRLEPNAPVALTSGDQVRMGPWTLRVVVGEPSATRRLPMTGDDRRFTSTMMQRLGEQALDSAAQRRLNILMRCAADLPGAEREEDIASVALRALVEGSGFPRCAIVRCVGEEVEVLAGRELGDARFSRSLIQAAADPGNDGQTVILNPGQATPEVVGQSVAALDITAALCAPVLVERLPPGGQDGVFTSTMMPKGVPIPEAFVYLDARGSSGAVLITSETIAFCQAVARVCGLALTNLQRRKVEHESNRRHAELTAARDVQRIIMPPSRGEFGGGAGRLRARYHVESIPGRFVAGDLFDVFAVGEDRVCMFLGDVVGKGAAAGMIMANVQAHLAQLLRVQEDPGAALAQVNALVTRYSERLGAEYGRVSLFISVFACSLDLRSGQVLYADAGHGYMLTSVPGGSPQRLTGTGGPPLGVSPDVEYHAASLTLPPGGRLVVFSDGVVEQRTASGLPFGFDGAEAAVILAGDADPTEPIVRAMRTHCGVTTFADDVTVACLAVSK